MLENLLSPLATSITSTTGGPSPVREAWAFDWLDHGDSAVVNSTQVAALGKGVSE